ncbi:hypothetical protein L9F63_023529, partial [Diploptera punctata]
FKVMDPKTNQEYIRSKLKENLRNVIKDKQKELTKKDMKHSLKTHGLVQDTATPCISVHTLGCYWTKYEMVIVGTLQKYFLNCHLFSSVSHQMVRSIENVTNAVKKLKSARELRSMRTSQL